MKKHLGLLTSLVVIFATALCFAGCTNYRGQDACCPDGYVQERGDICPQPSEPCPAPSSYGSTGQITHDGVLVTASQPKLCILGDNFALDVCIQACIDLCHAEVNLMLPEGMSLVRSEPPGLTEEDGLITWTFDRMMKGDTYNSRVILRADVEGNLCACFCVTAVPVQFCTILCAKPLLECCKTGPEEVAPCDPVHYTISVTNSGSCPAEDVVVVDNVPDGLEHSSGQRRLTWELGTIAAGETKCINVCFTATKRGQVCNTVNVTSCNAHPTSCQFCTNVVLCQGTIEKTGPKERKIGESADYSITVTNTGDTTLTGVVVCDQAPSATSIVEAPGAVVNGNQAVWRFDELRPGAKENLDITLTTCTPGYFVNRVSVDNCQRCRDCAEWGTRWRGTPALNGCFADTKDPICVGDFNTYTLRVTNQGSEEDTNLRVVLHFPSELVPVTTHGDTPATISGQTVTFDPVPIAGSRESLNFRVDAQAKDRGDARIKAEISSDSIKSPITLEESTIIN